jgi:hypothetical protein
LGLALFAPLAVRLKGFKFSFSQHWNFCLYWFIYFIKFNTVTGGAGIGRKTAGYTLLGINFEDGLEIGNYFLQKIKFFII